MGCVGFDLPRSLAIYSVIYELVWSVASALRLTTRACVIVYV